MTETIRVLFVDNEVVTREWLAQKLRRDYQYQIDCVDNGQDAIAKVKAEQGNYDVVLLDRRLEPGLDGITVMEQIRRTYPRIEAIIFTGYGDVSEGLQAMEAGACYYVFKPLNDKGLAFYIKSAADRGRLRDAALERDWLQNILSISKATTKSLAPEEVAREICERLASQISELKLFYIAYYDERRDEAQFLWAVDSEKKVEMKPRKLSASERLSENLFDITVDLSESYGIAVSKTKEQNYVNLEPCTKAVSFRSNG